MNRNFDKRGLHSGIAAMAFAAIIGGDIGERNMLDLKFRAQVFTNGAVGASLANIGYDPGGIVVGLNQFKDLSRSQAVTEAEKAVRFYQSSGIDCRGEVWGKPVEVTAAPYNLPGAPAPAEPVRALTGPEQAEQLYARIGVPHPGLKLAIIEANKAQGAGMGVPADENVNIEPG